MSHTVGISLGLPRLPDCYSEWLYQFALWLVNERIAMFCF